MEFYIPNLRLLWHIGETAEQAKRVKQLQLIMKHSSLYGYMTKIELSSLAKTSQMCNVTIKQLHGYHGNMSTEP